jgi:hypothetical protein
MHILTPEAEVDFGLPVLLVGAYLGIIGGLLLTNDEEGFIFSPNKILNAHIVAGRWILKWLPWRAAWRKRALPKKLEKAYKLLAKEVQALKQIQTAAEVVESWSTPYGASRWASDALSISEADRRLALKRSSPLALWMKQRIQTEKRRFTGVLFLDEGQSWDSKLSFKLAKKRQLKEYAFRLTEHLAKARILQERVNQLSGKLCIEAEDLLAEAGFDSPEPKLAEAVKARVEVEETLREELSRLRAELAKNDLDFRDPRFARIGELEDALLAEQPDDLPLRKAAGIPTDN